MPTSEIEKNGSNQNIQKNDSPFLDKSHEISKDVSDNLNLEIDFEALLHILATVHL